MDTPKIITLDLTNCKYLGEMHLRIKEAFDFPDYYGQNWSAFWDLLRDPRDYTIVEIKGLETLSKDFNPHVQKMLEIMERNKDEQNDFMKKYPQFDYRFDYKVID